MIPTKGMRGMTYGQYETLTEEEKGSLPDAELPVIPPEELHSGLRSVRMVRREGTRCWEVVRPEGDTVYRAEYKTKELSGIPFPYKYEPYGGTWIPDWPNPEPSTYEEPIGKYGEAWMDWMEEHHPCETDWMRLLHKFLTKAREVDKLAWEYRAVLERDYERMYPRPDGFEETVRWERTREWHVDSDVMTEIVLKMRTAEAD
jgi:hypothetical protein